MADGRRVADLDAVAGVPARGVVADDVVRRQLADLDAGAEAAARVVRLDEVVRSPRRARSPPTLSASSFPRMKLSSRARARRRHRCCRLMSLKRMSLSFASDRDAAAAVLDHVVLDPVVVGDRSSRELERHLGALEPDDLDTLAACVGDRVVEDRVLGAELQEDAAPPDIAIWLPSMRFSPANSSEDALPVFAAKLLSTMSVPRVVEYIAMPSAFARMCCRGSCCPCRSDPRRRGRCPPRRSPRCAGR